MHVAETAQAGKAVKPEDNRKITDMTQNVKRLTGVSFALCRRVEQKRAFPD